MKKAIVIESCINCLHFTKCDPSKSLTKQQRFALTFGVSAPDKFILKGCPLPDFNPSQP